MTNESPETSRSTPERTSSATLFTVREMIDNAFGDEERNIVNFKLLQTVITLIARQLRLLGRKVAVETTSSAVEAPSSSSLVISEIKIQAAIDKKRRSRKTLSSERTTRSRSKSPTDKRLSDKTPLEMLPSDRKVSGPLASKDTHKVKSLQRSLTGRSSESHEGTRLGTSPHRRVTERSLGEFPEKKSSRHRSGEYEETSKQSLRSAESTDMNKQRYFDLLEKIEEQREQILRIISQKQDSMQETGSTLTPIASMDSAEIRYEKLIVVQKAPQSTAELANRGADQRVMSIVTMEQFKQVRDAVTALQLRLDNKEFTSPHFPENAKLMQELRKGASLTDAMAALQLSARLEAAEKAIEQMTSLVTDLVKQTQGAGGSPNKHSPRKEVAEESSSKDILGDDDALQTSSFVPEAMSSEVELSKLKPSKTHALPVSRIQLKNAFTKEQYEIMEIILKIIRAADHTATDARHKAMQLDKKFAAIANVGPKLMQLEEAVESYAEKVNTIDTVLTSQLANYQDLLTQMQFDLEAALENMAEALASQGVDPELFLEMNANFSRLQNEMDKASLVQMEAMRNQKRFSNALENTRRDVELLRDIKCDRDEVSDALRDKAGIIDLNGLMTIEYHAAIMGDLEKRFQKTFDKTERQELVWQQVIDETFRKINDKVDIHYIENLRADITKHVNNLKQRVDDMLDIIGEPTAAAVTRRIYRDTTCLCCSSPAMPTTDAGLLNPPGLRPPAVGAEAPKTKEDGGHPVCTPGARIPHPINPKAEICSRYCGSKVPRRTNVPAKAFSFQTTSFPQAADVVGNDGKVYKSEEARKPCKQCNRQTEPMEGWEAVQGSTISLLPVDKAKMCLCNDIVAEAICPCGDGPVSAVPVVAGQTASNYSLVTGILSQSFD